MNPHSNPPTGGTGYSGRCWIKLRKYFAAILAGIFLLQPVFVLAQLGEVPTVGRGETGGIAGGILSAASKTALAGVSTANELCQKAEEVFQSANTIKGIAYGGLSLIGGNQTEVADLEIYKNAMDGFIKCREGARTALQAVATVNLYDGQTKQRLNDDINLALKNLQKRRDDIETQAKIAKRGLWKGILAAILIKTTKVVAQRLVNSLTAKFKINDVMRYADAVSSQVYQVQLIKDRAVDNQEQLILRSIITNPLLRTKIDSAIYQRAADALQLNGQAFSSRTMSADDPDFYLKLAKFGTPEASPQFLQTAYQNRASEIQSAGLSSAQNEILLGSGLKAPRTCAGNVNEQKAIDQRWIQVNDQMSNRAALYEDLQNTYNIKYAQLNDREKQQLVSDLKKAEADYLKAANQLKAMPASYDSPILTLCEKIASPAESVNKGIDAAFKSFSKGLSDYNDNNLPFFMNWVGDIGSNIASSLIFGGGVKATLLTESGNISQAANLALSFADANAAKKNLDNGISFNYENGNSASEYILSWEMVDVKNASFVTITGDGISDIQRDPATGQVRIDPVSRQPLMNRLPPSGSAAIQTKTGGNYILRVYDSSGKLLTNQASLKVNVSAASSDSSVQGVFIKKPAESLRGYRAESLR